MHIEQPSAEGIGWREANQLLLYGSGFVTVGSERLFVPFFGRPRYVPSPAEERRMASDSPRAWHLLMLAAICLIGGRMVLEVLEETRGLRGLLMPLVLLICAVAWFSRQRAVIRSWPVVSDPAVTRTGLALCAVAALPRGLKIVHLVLYAGAALLLLSALLHPRPISDPDLWIGLPIIFYGLFAVFRAARGFGLSLMR